VGPAPEVAEPLAASTVVLAPGWHRSLVLTAAVPLAPARASLGALATSLAGLWAVVFGLGLVASRVVCRRALAPVTRMAAAASAMDARDVGARLPVPHGGDELAGLGQSFNGLLGRLEESFERQRRFAGEASHQLRTPLAALLGQAEVALRRERGSNEYRQALDSVRRQALHLRGIVEALLFLARADAEAQAPGQERLDLATWLPGHLRHWDGHPRAADLRLEVEVERATWVNVHAPLLGALVDNLVDNACKYSQPGTPVTVRLGQKDGEARLEVVDAGPGIGPEDRGRLFEPFFRSEAARRAGVPGSGLGLAVACRLARTFHGRIEVDSARDRGTRFELCLPVAS
jgi:signal transduction histidine kinase